MAVTESVKIVFEVDDKALVSTVQQLQAVGKVSQEDAAKFNALSAASKAAGASLDGASKGAKQFADASKDVAKSTTEVAKSAGELKNIGPALAQAGQAGTQAGEGFVSLRTRLREATLELQRLEDEFGPFSQEAANARARAGELADQFDDLQRQIRLTNPEGKVQAFQKLGQGIVGAFSVATGALQAFGAENEQVQAIAQKLQGALNIAQGIQSIVGLKEAYDDVKVVLGFTTAAQNTLNASTKAGAVATDLAAGSTRGFAAALASTGIGAIVVALGALAGAYILLQSNTESYALSEEQLKDIKDQSKAATDALTDAENELALKRGDKSRQAVETEKLIKSISEQIGQARVRELAAEKALAEAQANYNLRIKAAIADNRQEEIDFITARVKTAEANKKIASDEIAALKAQFTAKKELIDLDAQDKKNQDETAKTKEKAQKAEEERRAQEQRANDTIQKRLSILAEEQKLREFNVELNKLYGASEEDILRQKLFNNQADQEALAAILEKAKGTKEYEAIQSQYNDAIREEIKLRKQIENQLEVQKIALKGIETQQGKTNDKTKQAIPIGKEVTTTATDLNKQLFDDEEKLAKQQQDRIDRAFQISNQVADIFIEAANRQYEEELASLEKARENGAITEEQYEAKVKQLKRKSAEDQKKAQIFQATMSAAQAILSALTIVADPATKAAAVAFAATVGALNLAKIIATPLPKFKKGTLSVPGTDTGDDSVMAMLRPGEAVIPTEINKEYASTIKAIYTRKVSSKELNEFIESRSRMTVVRDEPVFNFNPITMDALFKRDLRVSQMSSALERSTGASMPIIKVKADVDTYALSKAMAKNKGVELTNPEQVAKALAAELNKSNNLRRQ